MRILQICHKPPFPGVDGGTFAEKQFATLLVKAGHQVDLLALATAKHPADPDAVPYWFTDQGEYHSIEIDTKVKLTGAVQSQLKKDSYILSRFRQPVFLEKTRALIAATDYDLVVFDGLAAAVYANDVRSVFAKPLVLRSHNIEYLVWGRLKENTGFVAKKWYYGSQTKKLRREEEQIFSDVNAIWHISKSEIAQFPDYLQNKVRHVPLIHPTPITLVKEKTGLPLKLGFLASFNWQPNLEAAGFLIKKLLPALPGGKAEIVIAGRNQPDWMVNIHKRGVSNLGEVKTIREFFDQVDVFINPIFSGSGIKIKVIEAISYGIPVISTELGVEGIDLEENKDFVKAEDVQGFVRAVEQFIEQPELLEQLSENSLRKMESNFSLETGIDQLNKVLNEL